MLSLKPDHKSIRQYYVELEDFDRLGIKHEMAVRAAFQHVLEHCCHQVGWTLEQEYKIKTPGGRSISVDGGLVDKNFRIPLGFWEAKDSQDDLAKEIQKKFALGYPKDNIVFQAPTRAILWQGGIQVYDEDITEPNRLVGVVKGLFAYKDQTQITWEQAVEQFKTRIPQIAQKALQLIEIERKDSPLFIKAWSNFAETCRASINPNLSDAAIEEMLVQHLLTERIFRKVFHNSDFTDRNIIARDIERVIHALTARTFSREEFSKPLDHFYDALEQRAASLSDYSQQQAFVNTAYERFFQGFAVKQADTHGIVYTPQPIVDFMVRSVEEILKREFRKSLSDEGVHIIDPFVGTGNFITRMMQEIKTTALPHKYANELHCNEVMLLPYYVASMSIEHEYYERTRDYKPFEGICLVDTFELAEDKQPFLFTEENTERVEKLKQIKLFVVIGNPPYNSKQVNENDNNRNRKYTSIDARVSHTYAHDSAASNKNKLADPYVKAIRLASDKVLDNGEGVVAFVSNNSFIDNVAFDGMRRHLETDFDLIYVLDLGGNVRKNPKISGTIHNVFGIQVGVSINLFIRFNGEHNGARIFYARLDDFWRKEKKFSFLESSGTYSAVKWQEIKPSIKHTWLTEGLRSDFESMMLLGSIETRSMKSQTAFGMFSLGVNTNRDAWAYNSNQSLLCENMKATIAVYNQQVLDWNTKGIEGTKDIDDFVSDDESKISWSSSLKAHLRRGIIVKFNESNVRLSLYRPFEASFLYLDRYLTHRRGHWHQIFPTISAQSENRVICTSGIGSHKPFHCLVTNLIPGLDLLEKTQCFPFYTYSEDGTNRCENITDWAVEQFVSAIKPDVDKWQIFHYVYGLLHSPEYREKYQANLKRELPRIPLPKSIEQFHSVVSAGERLSELHVDYGNQQEYPLEMIETPGKPLDWRVQKMRLTKDKQAIVYNNFLTLSGIPQEVFEYRLGNRSALEWIIDRYQVRVEKRSGIVNDPNRPNDPQYIVKLIGKIITVSLEAVAKPPIGRNRVISRMKEVLVLLIFLVYASRRR